MCICLCVGWLYITVQVQGIIRSSDHHANVSIRFDPNKAERVDGQKKCRLGAHTCAEFYHENSSTNTVVRVRRFSSECVGSVVRPHNVVQNVGLLFEWWRGACSLTDWGGAGANCSKDIPAGWSQRDVQRVSVTGCLTSTCHITMLVFVVSHQAVWSQIHNLSA